MKFSALWATVILISSSTAFVQPQSKSLLQVNCAPSRIQDGPQVSKLSFCQSSKKFGQMTILTSEGFGLRATKLLDSQLASVNLESQETKIRTQSGEFVLEARPDADPNKSWHGFLHGAKKLEKYPQELSCRVALVSDCQSEL